MDGKEATFELVACNNTFVLAKTLHSVSDHGSDKILQCCICNTCFPSKEALEQHSAVHSQKPFKCDLGSCNFATKYSECLETHQKTFHINENLENGIERDSSTEVSLFKCTICNYLICDEADFKSHALVHAVKIKYSDPAFKHLDSSVARKEISKKAQIFKCNKCSSVSLSAVAFKFHMLEYHKKDKFYKCNECHSFFSEARLLAEHDLRNHNKIDKTETLYVCDESECESYFRTASGLRIHVQSQHRNARTRIKPEVKP